MLDAGPVFLLCGQYGRRLYLFVFLLCFFVCPQNAARRSLSIFIGLTGDLSLFFCLYFFGPFYNISFLRTTMAAPSSYNRSNFERGPVQYLFL
jgi:hypothetical protein